MNHCLHFANLILQNHNVSIMLMICQCAEESVYRRKDNCYDIIMHLY